VSKLREDLSIGLLGAAAGLFSSSIILLVARIDTYYAYLSRTHSETYDAFNRVEGLEWIPLSFWHITLSVVASLLVHRYLATRIKSPFLLWQLIGVASLHGWAITAFLIVSMTCILEGNLTSLEYLLNSEKAWDIGQRAAIVFACNVFYGSVISASSRQYVERSIEI
jgi:hypothetical protein